MHFSKKIMLASYRWGTQPYRWANRIWAQRTGMVPISLLFYHRVAEDLNPWTISFQGFQRQIDWLQKHFELVSLWEAQQRILRGWNDRPAVSITFDDGYADNCLRAIPLLLERKIPFTYFVVWENIRDGRPFPHDAALGKPLATNSLESIRALAEMGVEIGSHSQTHPDIGSIADRDRLLREVADSKRELEAAIGKEIRYFAFPFGQRINLSPAAFEVGKQAGYLGMCSAYGGYNDIGGEAFHLQRFHGDPHLEYLKNWLNFDPRMRQIRRYEYSAVPSAGAEAIHSTELAGAGK